MKVIIPFVSQVSCVSSNIPIANQHNIQEFLEIMLSDCEDLKVGLSIENKIYEMNQEAFSLVFPYPKSEFLSCFLSSGMKV